MTSIHQRWILQKMALTIKSLNIVKQIALLQCNCNARHPLQAHNRAYEHFICILIREALQFTNFGSATHMDCNYEVIFPSKDDKKTFCICHGIMPKCITRPHPIRVGGWV